MSKGRRILLLTGGGAHALHEGVVAYAREAHWVLDSRMSYTGQLPDGAVADGVLCDNLERADVTGLLRGLGVPVVGMNNDRATAWPGVTCCDQSIGRIAARHLLERGYATLGFYEQRFSAKSAQRMQGFKAEVEEAGARFVRLAPPEGTPAAGRLDVVREWIGPMLTTLRLPVAVMVESDLHALPMIDTLAACGYRVPEQVAIISAGNDPMLCDVAPIPVSSVDTRQREVGHTAAHLLDQLIDGRPPSDEPMRVAPGPVTVRESTDMMALPNIHTAQALRVIWTRYREPINVDSVASHVTVTRRRLQTLFHEQLGRTMQQELARVRMADACLMLKQSTLRIRDIATLAGFKSSLHFHRTAQSLLGMGPKAFRERGTLPAFGVVPALVGTRLPTG